MNKENNKNNVMQQNIGTAQHIEVPNFGDKTLRLAEKISQNKSHGMGATGRIINKKNWAFFTRYFW